SCPGRARAPRGHTSSSQHLRTFLSSFQTFPSRSHLCGNFRSSSAYSAGFHGSSGSPGSTVPAHFCCQSSEFLWVHFLGFPDHLDIGIVTLDGVQLLGNLPAIVFI